MRLSSRLHYAISASFKHLLASLVVASLSAILVFAIWYPYPYDDLVGGQALFLILISVDVISGPVLTMVVFNPSKPRSELIRDIGIIVLLQFSALVYGLHTMALARPVYLAFEFDQFRVVRMADIDTTDLPKAPQFLRNPGWFGPNLIGVHIPTPKDREFIDSVMMDMNGIHPSFRPENWLAYTQQHQEVIARAKPLKVLFTKYPLRHGEIEDAIAKSGLHESQLGYLPVSAGTHTDYVMLINLSNAQPQGFIHMDGW